jgi:hypothetical protein
MSNYNHESTKQLGYYGYASFKKIIKFNLICMALGVAMEWGGD